VPDPVLIRSASDPARAAIERRIRFVLDNHTGEFAGFAVIVWDEKSGYICDQDAFKGSQFPLEMIGDFIRNALFADAVRSRVAADYSPQKPESV
jgi:hypothetical protein